MIVGDGGSDSDLGDAGIVIDESAGRGDELQRVPGVVDNIPNEVNRSAEDWLGAQATGGRIETAVSEHANVVHAAVCLDDVITRDIDIVVVEINGDGLLSRNPCECRPVG